MMYNTALVRIDVRESAYLGYRFGFDEEDAERLMTETARLFSFVDESCEIDGEAGAGRRLAGAALVVLRVQNSVLEVLVDAAQLVTLKNMLSKVIDEECDSIRFYRLGNTYQNRIDTMGKSTPIQAGEPILL